MKNIIIRWMILLFLFFCKPLLAEHLLVIVWDGADMGVIRSMYANHMLPNLESMGMLSQLTSLVPCYGKKCQAGATRDQHAVMLTGVDASINNIWNNGRYTDPGSLNSIPSGLTIYEKLKKTVPGIKIAQIGKCRLFGKDTLRNAIPSIDIFEDCSSSGKLLTAQESSDHVMRVMQAWENEDNYFILANFAIPDQVGHLKGIMSIEYRDALMLNDKLLGSILSAMPSDGDAFVIGDHGFGDINTDTGQSRPHSHTDRNTETILVEKGKSYKNNLYINQLAPKWACLFLKPILQPMYVLDCH